MLLNFTAGLSRRIPQKELKNMPSKGSKGINPVQHSERSAGTKKGGKKKSAAKKKATKKR
jgi:hypothetical protein